MSRLSGACWQSIELVIVPVALRVKILTRDEETGTLARRLFLSCAPWVKKKGEREKKRTAAAVVSYHVCYKNRRSAGSLDGRK